MKKFIYFSIIAMLIIIGIIVFILVKKKEIDVSFELYGTALPYNNGELYEIETEFSGIIDYDELRIVCNEKRFYELEEIDFSKEAYLVLSGKKVKRAYYKPFDKIEMLNKERGYILYIEYEDMKLTNVKYIYILDNTKGRFCTEDDTICYPYQGNFISNLFN